jgi:hypothetical protein
MHNRRGTWRFKLTNSIYFLSIVVLCCGARNAPSCSTDKSPWESEMMTKWTVDELRPTFLSDSSCKHEISVSSTRSTKVESAVHFAIGNASSDFRENQAQSVHHGFVFVVGNGQNEGIWVNYHPDCLGALVSSQQKMLTTTLNT